MSAVPVGKQSVSSATRQVVQCPGCGTRFAVNASVLEGVESPRFHCSRCDKVFGIEESEASQRQTYEPSLPEGPARDERDLTPRGSDRQSGISGSQLDGAQQVEEAQEEEAEDYSGPSLFRDDPRGLRRRQAEQTSLPFDSAAESERPPRRGVLASAADAKQEAPRRAPFDHLNPPAPRSGPPRAELFPQWRLMEDDRGGEKSDQRVDERESESSEFQDEPTLEFDRPTETLSRDERLSYVSSAEILDDPVNAADTSELPPLAGIERQIGEQDLSGPIEYSAWGDETVVEQGSRAIEHAAGLDGVRGEAAIQRRTVLPLAIPLLLVLLTFCGAWFVFTQFPAFAAGVSAVVTPGTRQVPPAGVMVSQLVVRPVQLDSGEEITLLSGVLINSLTQEFREAEVEGLLYDEKGELLGRAVTSANSQIGSLRLEPLALNAIERAQHEVPVRRAIKSGEERKFLIAFTKVRPDKVSYMAARVFSVQPQ